MHGPLQIISCLTQAFARWKKPPSTRGSGFDLSGHGCYGEPADAASPQPLCAEPDWVSPHRRRAHGALQLSVRARQGRSVHSADRGHGPRALDLRVRASDFRQPALAAHRLGRGPIFPEPAERSLQGARPGPRASGTCVPLLLLRGGARAKARDGASRGPQTLLRPHVPQPHRSAGRSVRDPFPRGGVRRDRFSGHDQGTRHVSKRGARRPHHRALGRLRRPTIFA